MNREALEAAEEFMYYRVNPDNKVHGVNMGTIWVLSAPDGPHVGPMNLASREDQYQGIFIYPFVQLYMTNTSDDDPLQQENFENIIDRSRKIPRHFECLLNIKHILLNLLPALPHVHLSQKMIIAIMMLFFVVML